MDAPAPQPPITDPGVAAAFAAFPAEARDRLLELRRLIFDVAATLPAVTGLTECLKWGQPAYPTQNKAGTTLRLGVPKTGGIAIYAPCQSTVIPDFADRFPGAFRIEGTRAVHLDARAALPRDALSILIAQALTYRCR